jgi:2-oxoisovalerate dehydrogenase E1 component
MKLVSELSSAAAYPLRSSNLPETERRGLEARMMDLIARIRAFELELLDLFSQGKLSGTTHTYVGQEVCAAGLYAAIDPERDAVFTNHRCHGHFLAYGGPMPSLLAEIMGKFGGTCGGRGGSQHLCYRRFFSQGIQGGSMPIAAGYAYLFKQRQTGGLVVAHIGDGTLGEGIVYETLNLVSLLSLPLLIVLEYNGVAQSTDTARTTAGDTEARFRAFGLETDRRRAADPLALAGHFAEVAQHVRGGRPFVQILDTFRLMPHSKGDDDRPADLLKQAWKQDYFQGLLDRGDSYAHTAWDQARAEVRQLVTNLEGQSQAELGAVRAYAEPAQPLFTSSADLLPRADQGDTQRRINELLGMGLDQCLASDSEVLLLGEDLLDPYGGAFKVARGLSTKYPTRVFSTPISEAAIVGFGNGFALAGGKAVVEIMFGDFVALAADQIINQAAKAHFMYGGQVTVPNTIRLVSGGYRGYGPTHSQSLESLFCGVAGLKVVALSRRHRPQTLLRAAVLDDPTPVVFVENKLLYSLRPHAAAPVGFHFRPTAPAQAGHYPSLAFSTVEAGKTADVTVVTYGGMTDMVEEALEHLLLEEELDFDYFILTQLSPLHLDEVIASAARTQHLVTLEEGPLAFGIGGEVVARVTDALGGRGLKTARVGARDMPIASARHQEREVLPSWDDIIAAILKTV